MSEVKVNKLSPRSGTTVTLGDSGDTISIPSGVTLTGDLNASNLTSGTVPSARVSGAYTGITSLGTITTFRSTGIDDNADALAMTIDSSENIQIAKTARSDDTVGHSLQADGLAVHTRDGNEAMFLNRKSSDGKILSLRKDNSEVGNIGAIGGDLAIGTGDAGLRFYNSGDSIFPVNTSSSYGVRDNATDLGYSGGRFKDLYLGGGLYVGGTDTAHKLDDYEEGTWTPVFAGSGNAGTYTYTTQVGTYTKIGRLVTVNCELLNITQAVAADGSVRINGLPLTSSSTCNSWGSISLDRFTFTGYEYCVANVGASKGFVYIWKIRQSNTDSLLEPGDRDQDGSDLKFTISYEV
jgi:hypothetical protein